MLSEPNRGPKDRARDLSRRTADTIEIATLSPNQTILELEPGQGWFTDILLCLTAENGRLTVQQPATLDAFFGKKARQRIKQSGHPRAIYSDASWKTLACLDNSVDRVVWIQGPHELWFKLPSGENLGAPRIVFSEIVRVLKPNGYLLVIDNLAQADVPLDKTAPLHRSNPSLLKTMFEEVGLVLEVQDENWIANRDDPLSVPTYDPKVHLKTHQFLQLFQKPAYNSTNTCGGT